MKITPPSATVTAASLLTGSLLLAAAPGRDVVAFQPAEGLELSRSLQFEFIFHLEDLWANVDGEEMPAEMVMDQVDEGLAIEASYEVADQLLQTEEGRHVELVRTYEAISVEAGLESEMEEVEEVDGLLDRPVRFLWNEDDEGYDVSFVEEEGDEELLEGLEADMDFLALLPEGEVAQGDRWSVSGESIGTVFMPGGVEGPADEDSGDETLDMVLESVEEQLETLFTDLSLDCEYKGIRSEEEVEVGVIEWTFEGSTPVDFSEVLEEIMSQQEIPGEISASLTLDVDLEGQGTLLWNLEAGHVHEFQMEAELTLVAEAEASADVDGEAHDAEATAEVYGEMSWEMRAR